MRTLPAKAVALRSSCTIRSSRRSSNPLRVSLRPRIASRTTVTVTMTTRPKIPKPRSSPTIPAIRYAIPPAMATPGTTHCWADRCLVSFVGIEDLLHDQVEMAGDGQGQGQRRQVATVLDRVDRLPGHPERRCQGGLREVTLLTQRTNPIAHHRTRPMSSLLVTWSSVRRVVPDVKRACHPGPHRLHVVGSLSGGHARRDVDRGGGAGHRGGSGLQFRRGDPSPGAFAALTGA